jgi:hypothetical protein
VRPTAIFDCSTPRSPAAALTGCIPARQRCSCLGFRRRSTFRAPSTVTRMHPKHSSRGHPSLQSIVGQFPYPPLAHSLSVRPRLSGLTLVIAPALSRWGLDGQDPLLCYFEPALSLRRFPASSTPRPRPTLQSFLPSFCLPRPTRGPASPCWITPYLPSCTNHRHLRLPDIYLKLDYIFGVTTPLTSGQKESTRL